MARTLLRTLSLTRSSPGLIHKISASISQQHQQLSPSSPTVGVAGRRYRSTRGQFIEVDLDSSSSSPDGDIEVLGLTKKLEDIIYDITVRQTAPDWLPFRPGSSYWVPPKRRADNFREFVGKLAHPLTEEETLSFTSVRGWPSSSFFIEEGASPTFKKKEGASPNKAPVGMKVLLHLQSDSDMEKPSESEDEE